MGDTARQVISPDKSMNFNLTENEPGVLRPGGEELEDQGWVLGIEADEGSAFAWNLFVPAPDCLMKVSVSLPHVRHFTDRQPFALCLPGEMVRFTDRSTAPIPRGLPSLCVFGAIMSYCFRMNPTARRPFSRGGRNSSRVWGSNRDRSEISGGE